MVDNKETNPIIVAHIIGKWVGGGVESVVMNYYRNIDKSKFQFDFIIDSDSKDIPIDEINSLGGNVILVPPYQHLFKYQNSLKKLFRERQYSIVHSHINTLSVFPLRIAKKTGIKIRIAHSHSTTNKKEWKRNILKKILLPFSKIYATHYFACGELAGRFLFGNKVYDSGQVFILNNAIDLRNFKYNEHIRNKKRNEFEVKSNQIVIGHVGRFVSQKNHKFLIDIFYEIYKINNNSVLFLVGQGPLKKEVEQKVKLMGLEENVKFLGQRKDISELYQVFDILLLPSLYEGLSVVGVEAQCAGLLCIFSDCITKELKLLDSTDYISLKENAGSWAYKVLDKYNKNYDRRSQKEIRNFDIKSEVVKLEKKYIELIKE